jgi:NAD(P)-dependent dehydrogenase (short-subunit alcohol dehydrogenase family)
MPPPPRTAAVTGASGFIGGALTRGLLARGYAVAAVVRDPASPALEHLRRMQAAHPGALRLAHVPALTSASEELARALSGAAVVFHAASPIGQAAEGMSEDECVCGAARARARARAGCGRARCARCAAGLTWFCGAAGVPSGFAEGFWRRRRTRPGSCCGRRRRRGVRAPS